MQIQLATFQMHTPRMMSPLRFRFSSLPSTNYSCVHPRHRYKSQADTVSKTPALLSLDTTLMGNRYIWRYLYRLCPCTCPSHTKSNRPQTRQPSIPRMKPHPYSRWCLILSDIGRTPTRSLNLKNNLLGTSDRSSHSRCFGIFLARRAGTKLSRGGADTFQRRTLGTTSSHPRCYDRTLKGIGRNSRQTSRPSNPCKRPDPFCPLCSSR